MSALYTCPRCNLLLTTINHKWHRIESCTVDPDSGEYAFEITTNDDFIHSECPDCGTAYLSKIELKPAILDDLLRLKERLRSEAGDDWEKYDHGIPLDNEELIRTIFKGSV